MPRVSSEAMALHVEPRGPPDLEEVSEQAGKSAHAVPVCDGAGWHQPGARLAVPENVTLPRLPPYAPGLNPMENVWECLRGNALGMTVWEGYDACCDAWNGLMADAKRITSITIRTRAQVKV